MHQLQLMTLARDWVLLPRKTEHQCSNHHFSLPAVSDTSSLYDMDAYRKFFPVLLPLPALHPTDSEPSDHEVESIRNSVRCQIEEKGSDAFDERDIDRINVDDHYIRRFIAENAHDLNKTRKNILETLRWRKENCINDVSFNDVKSEMSKLTHVGAHNRDIHGCKIFVVKVRKHIKANIETELIKKNLIYWLERFEREEYGGQITIFFDMTDTCMANVDYGYMKYLITVMEKYYPWILAKVIVLNLPRPLVWVYKLLKSWLPAKAVALVHLIDNMDSLGKLVAPDQCLEEWGGTDRSDLKFVEEVDPSQKPWLQRESNVNHLYYARRRM